MTPSFTLDHAAHTFSPQISEDCVPRSSIPRPGHACMDQRLDYAESPPRAGSHRPLWPAFGEYRYLPPPRWVHALEHGAAVFLYHPCADRVRACVGRGMGVCVSTCVRCVEACLCVCVCVCVCVKCVCVCDPPFRVE